MGATQRSRLLLDKGWSMCSAAPGETSAPPADAGWRSIHGAVPAAAALRERGEWALDAPAVDFDASDWWYRLQFDRPPLPRDAGVVLGFDGLATLAQVQLNGKPLLASDNMFVRSERDVSRLLLDRGNELLIRFGALNAELARRRARPRWRAPMVAHQQLRWWRTTLLGRTPGWSPPAAVVGPWRPVWIGQRDSIDAADVQLEAFVDGDAGVVRCRVQPRAGSAPRVEDVTLLVEGQGATHELVLQAGGGGYSGELRIAHPRLWWPHTHGEPSLYAATLRVRGGEEARHALAPLGFRTIAIDAAGGDFRVLVNGVPIFCRGACWTPLDPVSLCASPERYRAALAQARAAGMNMLRVMGTTVYEEDHFYGLCDELGLLVWQDFMFANMDYPGQDGTFVESVTLEARQQLRRLAAHPCVAVLCGNSEVEQQAAMWGAAREHWSSPLFDQVLRELCLAHAPRIPYWPSSAHGGAFPHQADAGTTSYYGVGAYRRPLDDARRCGLRFATECLAFANVPQPATLERMPGSAGIRVQHAAWKARSPRDLGAGWDFDDVRDHCIQQVFGVDPLQVRTTDHERYLLFGRIAVAEMMAAAFSEWRRPGSSCRGALVLFLRDLWAGAGWGVVDDGGVPKSCWYALKRVLQPVCVLLTDEGGNGLAVHVVNERDEPLAGAVELTAWRDGDVRVANGQRTLELPARGAASLSAIELLDGFVDLSYAYRFGPMVADAVTVTLCDRGGAVLSRAFHFPGGLQARPQRDAGLQARARMLADGTAELVVRAGSLAQAVHFDIPGYLADDEYFHLAPGSDARVTLRPVAAQPLAGCVRASNAARAATIEVEAAS